MSRNLRLGVEMITSLWNLTSSSTALQTTYPSYSIAVRHLENNISWLRDFARSVGKTIVGCKDKLAALDISGTASDYKLWWKSHAQLFRHRTWPEWTFIHRHLGTRPNEISTNISKNSNHKLQVQKLVAQDDFVQLMLTIFRTWSCQSSQASFSLK